MSYYCFPISLLIQHVMPAISPRNLGDNVDDKFNFKEHISQMYQTCYYNIRDLRRIRR